jgi:hypothetical protein
MPASASLTETLPNVYLTRLAFHDKRDAARFQGHGGGAPFAGQIAAANWRAGPR